MTIDFRCPSCGQVLQAEPQHAGLQTRCPNCGQQSAIPGQPAVVSAAPPPPPPPAAAPPGVPTMPPLNLAEEVTLWEGRTSHWFLSGYYGLAGILGIVGLAVLVSGGLIVGLVLMAVGAVVALTAVRRRVGYRYVVTNRRIIEQRGGQQLRIPIHDVKRMDARKGLTGVGNIRFIGGEQDGRPVRIRFVGIWNPETVKHMVQYYGQYRP